MGHQNHSTGLRLPVTNRWNSKWSLSVKNKYYKFLLHQDLLIKEFLVEFLKQKYSLEIGNCLIKRSKNMTFLFIPINLDKQLTNININKKILKLELQEYIFNFTGTKLKIFLIPIKNILLEPVLLANFIANEIENRKNLFFIFQQLLQNKLNQAESDLIKHNVKGIKVQASGRLNGADRGRITKMLWGSVPLSTLKSEILFGKQTAFTKYGTIGVKVWVYVKE